jgi:hypothetical protein
MFTLHLKCPEDASTRCKVSPDVLGTSGHKVFTDRVLLWNSL